MLINLRYLFRRHTLSNIDILKMIHDRAPSALKVSATLILFGSVSNQSYPGGLKFYVKC